MQRCAECDCVDGPCNWIAPPRRWRAFWRSVWDGFTCLKYLFVAVMNLWPEQWTGGAIFGACLAIPLLGCALAIHFDNMNWLVLLAPLIVFMEGAFLLIPLAWVVVAIILDK